MEEKLFTLVQMFWLGASLLESDYEHEFLLAVNLLKQVSHRTTTLYVLSLATFYSVDKSRKGFSFGGMFSFARLLFVYGDVPCTIGEFECHHFVYTAKAFNYTEPLR